MDKTYCGDHLVVYTKIKLVCCIENNMLHTNFTSIKKKRNETSLLYLDSFLPKNSMRKQLQLQNHILFNHFLSLFPKHTKSLL